MFIWIFVLLLPCVDGTLRRYHDRSQASSLRRVNGFVVHSESLRFLPRVLDRGLRREGGGYDGQGRRRGGG